MTGHEGCLRVLHELGAGGSLSVAGDNGVTPAHLVARMGHEGCLRALHELGAAVSLTVAGPSGVTPAHFAAQKGHEGCLRALGDLGAAAGSFGAMDAIKGSPAHYAAHGGHAECLTVLHDCLSAAIGPVLASLGQFNGTCPLAVAELREMQGLHTSDDNQQTPAEVAARAGHIDCLRVFVAIPGAMTQLLDSASQHPEYLEEGGIHQCLLSEPGLVDVKTTQTWLAWRLEKVVGDADATQLSLVSDRTNVLEGLCAHLGVNEGIGHLIGGGAALPFALDVQFLGEAAIGDGLRREWFRHTVTEMLDPSRGLFLSKDGNRTLQPNPHSEIAGGPDHLSYFALLGRITGLALSPRCSTPAEGCS